MPGCRPSPRRVGGPGGERAPGPGAYPVLVTGGGKAAVDGHIRDGDPEPGRRRPLPHRPATAAGRAAGGSCSGAAPASARRARPVPRPGRPGASPTTARDHRTRRGDARDAGAGSRRRRPRAATPTAPAAHGPARAAARTVPDTPPRRPGPHRPRSPPRHPACGAPPPPPNSFSAPARTRPPFRAGAAGGSGPSVTRLPAPPGHGSTGRRPDCPAWAGRRRARAAADATPVPVSP